MLTVRTLSRKQVYYFASPYTHPDAYVREMRYLQVIKYATELINFGYTLLEPIAMSHQHAQRFGLPSGYEFWKNRDRTFIERSDAVMVCMMDGWNESVGVKDEIAYAEELGKLVYYLDPESMMVMSKIEAAAQLGTADGIPA